VPVTKKSTTKKADSTKKTAKVKGKGAVVTKKSAKKKVTEVKTEGLKRTAVVRKTKSVKRAERPATAAVVEPEEIYAPDWDDQEFTAEEDAAMEELYAETIANVREGEIVKGRIQAVGRDEVIVDVGFKSEGSIPIGQFGVPLNITVGDEIDVFLDAVEDAEGQLVLSKTKADFLRVWDEIREAYDEGVLIDGRIQRRIKGGLVVDLFGVEAFLPGSQVGLRQIIDFDSLINQTLPMKIIKLNKNRRNIVVSRRVVLEAERDELRGKLLQEIAIDQVRSGRVKNITDFGVFIDLGGVDGLLHITDMSWGRIRHPSEMVAVGEEIDVKILDFDTKSNRISLGLKQLTPYPWDDVDTKYPVGSRVTGRVVSITDYGAFVELERGVEGLVHISEMSWTHHVRHPSKYMQVGDTIEAMVLNVDKDHQKVSLGIKQLEPDPWSMVEQKYPVGSQQEGRVRNLTAFGAFVELEEGIDGLVHISDLSWTRRVQHPSEILKRGDAVKVIVLSIDVENRKISLGHKQVEEDPWPTYHERFRVSNEMKGKIVRLLDRGVVVEIDDEVEGFVPLNQLGVKEMERPEQAFKVDDIIDLKVIEFDPTNRRIVLSVDAFYRDRDGAEFEQFIASHPIIIEEPVEETAEADAEATKEETPAAETAESVTTEEAPAETEAATEVATEAAPEAATETPAETVAETAPEAEAPTEEAAVEETAAATEPETTEAATEAAEPEKKPEE
jgi:small subunit ribosomal protein S1